MTAPAVHFDRHVEHHARLTMTFAHPDLTVADVHTFAHACAEHALPTAAVVTVQSGNAGTQAEISAYDLDRLDITDPNEVTV